MSEFNDGGLAERGGGGLANPGGPNTAGGGGGQANRSGMGLGVNSGNGWARNPYNTGVGPNAPAGTIAAQVAYAAARKRAAAAGLPAPPVPVDPVTKRPLELPPQNLQPPYSGTPPVPGQYSGYGSWPNVPLGPIPEDNPPDFGTMPQPNYNWGADPHGYGFGATTNNNASGSGQGASTDYAHDPIDPGSAGPTGMNRRQFGGPVAPGQQYTVGENGPETLQMGPGGGGQVIPHNPMDRLGGMNPQMMQQFYQLMQQHQKAQPGGGFQSGQPMPGQPPAPQQMVDPAKKPLGPGGGYNAPVRPAAMGQPQMGIAGLSRPQQGGGGYGWGGSGLGQPGIMQQLAGRRMG